jgi:hypothetical protein
MDTGTASSDPSGYVRMLCTELLNKNVTVRGELGVCDTSGEGGKRGEMGVKWVKKR